MFRLPTLPPHTLRAPLQRLRGFTLIEQLAVITLVGAGAAAALPALQQVHQQAEATALASLAAAATSAAMLNQAGCALTQGRAVPGKCQPLHDCSQVAGLLAPALPAGFALLPGALRPEGSACLLQRVHDGALAPVHAAAAGD